MKRLLCILVLFYTAADTQPDTRFRSYGKATVNGIPLHFRGGAAGYEGGADFITVGKLDGNPYAGPYKNIHDQASEIARRWMFLRWDSPDCAWFDYPCQSGRDEYKIWVEALSGQSTHHYMTSVLNAQFNSETTNRGDGMSWVEYWTRQMAAHLEQKRPGESPVIYFEVANEPNFFPAIPPGGYAWYYLKYRSYISSMVNVINVERSYLSKPPISFKVGMGGLLVVDGFSDAVNDLLDGPVSFTLSHIDFDTEIFPSAVSYLFLFCMELLERNTSCTEAVDFGNLHFYPYVGVHSNKTVSQQLGTLYATAALMHPFVGDSIWLTEVGNVNPGAESVIADGVMDEVLTALKDGTVGPINRWYWYKHTGSDNKFALLPKTIPEIDQHWFIDLLLWYGGYSLPNIGSTARSHLNAMIAAWDASPPKTALLKSDLAHTALGATYARYAYDSKKVTPALTPLLFRR